MGRKYELVQSEYPNLYHIRALRDFCDVREGDVGGLVASEQNLSHDGNCWVAEKALVCGDARVYGNALVSQGAEVFENAMATKLELAIYMSGLRYDEGLRLTPYKVPNGPWTIGYGHKLTQAELRRVKQITPEQAEKLLLEDTVEAICDARVVCENFDVLSLPRKSVIVNMAFHLGRHRLKRLKKFLSAVAAYNYDAAAAAMLRAKWLQGARARRLVGLMQQESDIAI
jgi:GH24 family phage-related lysozyme (muramidase)